MWNLKFFLALIASGIVLMAAPAYATNCEARLVIQPDGSSPYILTGSTDDLTARFAVIKAVAPSGNSVVRQPLVAWTIASCLQSSLNGSF